MAELLFRKIVIIGRENIPQSRGYIIAANHVSYFDPAVIGYAIWRCIRSDIIYLAKSELGETKFWQWFFRHYHVIFIKRGEGNRETLEKILDLLKDDKIILVFPQESSLPEKQKIKSGVGFLAVISQKPILPVKIEISGYYRERKFWPFLIMILKWFFGPGRIKVKFGQLVSFDANTQDRREITNLVMEKIWKL